MPELTEEQRLAATRRGRAVLVSAAAGSGKTTVLTERVLRLCLEGSDPADIDRLLVVTFTEKAALEMRERIARGIAERAKAGDARAAEQLRLLPQAQISTIHAFGYALLLEEWERAGRDPELQLLDERQSTLVRMRALDSALERAYAQRAGMADLVGYFGGMGEDDALRAAVLEAARFLDALPDGEAALGRMLARAESREHFGEMLRLLREESRRALRQGASLMRQAALAAESEGDPDLARALRTEGERLRELGTAEDPGDWAVHRMDALAAAEFPTLKGITKCRLAERLRSQAKARVRSVADWLAASPEDLLWQRQVEALPRLRLFADVLVDFRAAYREEKLLRRALDFSDLEQEAHRLLAAPDGAVRERLRHRYREVLVDEFQDVSPLQNAIVQAIAGEVDGTDLFLVGDPKQSIYGFRHAAPDIFRGRQATLAGSGASLPLQENFRCRPEIVEVVNHIFAELMREAESPRYDAQARLVAGRAGGTKAPAAEAVRLVLIGGRDGDERAAETEEAEEPGEAELAREGEEVEGAAAQEATWIAREIARLVAEGHPVYDRDARVIRPIQYRDCAVLLRGLSSVAADYQDAFEAAGVPAEVQRSAGYMGSLEIQTLLGLLRAIELPQRDRDLAILLRAPWCGVSARDLRSLRDASGGGSLFDGLTALAEGDARMREVRDMIASWRAASLAMPLQAFVPWLLRETGYRTYVAGRPHSARRLRDIDDFESKAVRFGMQGAGGLGLFLREFEELGRREIDEAPPMAGVDDAVSVLTVHRSKGLEWPVVFVAGLHRPMQVPDGQPTLRWHLRHGVGAAWVDLPRGVRRETAALRAIRAETRAEQRREEIRLLYVALTRARDRLYLTAIRRGPDPVPGMDEDRLLGARCQLDWIWPCLAGAGQLPVRILREPAPLGVMRAEGAFDLFSAAPDPQAVRYLKALRDAAQPQPLLPARLSATDLADAAEGSFAAALRRRHRHRALRPELDASGGRTRGTQTHLLLQHLDYRRPARDIPAQLGELIAQGVLPPEARQAVDLGAVQRFLASPLAERLRAAPRLQRELAFSLLVDARGRPAQDGEILLQGKIDLLVRDAAGWLIVDFKTDHIPAEDAPRAAQAYAGQIDVYRAAVRAIAGARDVDAVLVFLQPGVIVSA